MMIIPVGLFRRTKPRAKTNWKYVIWPTLFLWVVSALYVFLSGLQSQAAVVLPLLMGVGFMFVLVGNGLAGSLAQNRLDVETVYGTATSCTSCGRSNCHLEVISYEYAIFLGIAMIERRVGGKFCRECAKRIVNRGFLASVVGGILFPPLILFTLIKRYAILRKYRNDPGI